MIYLILAICSSAAIAILMRLSSQHVKADLSVLATNYLVCMIFGAAYAGFDILPTKTAGLPLAIGFGIIQGIFYLVGFVLLQANTKKHGAVLSQLFMKLGLLVPIATTIFWFKEVPTVLQVAGFSIAILAIILMNLKLGGIESTKDSGWKLGLIFLLLSGGCGDVMAKMFEFYGNPVLDDQFLFYVFFTCFVLCLLIVIHKKERPAKVDLLFGALIGVPNFFSAKFLLGALMDLPAVLVYPTFSVGVILVVTFVGVLAFKERLRKLQWIALVGILLALVFLNI